MTCRASLLAGFVTWALLASPAAAQRYVESARLVPGPTASGAEFGVAVAVDGSLVAVGAPGTAGGAVHVGDLSAGSTLTRIAGPEGSTRFGASVSLVRGILAVGDPEAQGGTGRFVVHQRAAGGAYGTPLTPTLPVDFGARVRGLGASVALVPPEPGSAGDGWLLAVGAPGSGQAFLASRSAAGATGGWASTPAFEGAGGTVAACRSLAGDPVVLIGSADPSARHDVLVWRPLRASGPTTETLPNSADVPGFGSALACAPGFAVVGVPGAGSAQRFIEAEAVGGPTYGARVGASLVPLGGGAAESFGRSVAVLGSGMAFVGEPAFEDVSGRGAAYQFPLAPPAGPRRFLLAATGMPRLQGPGASLAVSSDGAIAVVGDPEALAAVVFRVQETPVACEGDADAACLGEPCVGGVCCDRPCDNACASCATGFCTRIPMCEPDGGTVGVDAGALPLDAGGLALDGGEASGDAAALDGATPFDAGGPVVPLTRFAGGGGCRCAAAGRGEAGAAWLAVAGLSALLGMRRSRRASRR